MLCRTAEQAVAGAEGLDQILCGHFATRRIEDLRRRHPIQGERPEGLSVLIPAIDVPLIAIVDGAAEARSLRTVVSPVDRAS